MSWQQIAFIFFLHAILSLAYKLSSIYHPLVMAVADDDAAKVKKAEVSFCPSVVERRPIPLSLLLLLY